MNIKKMILSIFLLEYSLIGKKAKKQENHVF